MFRFLFVGAICAAIVIVPAQAAPPRVGRSASAGNQKEGADYGEAEYT